MKCKYFVFDILKNRHSTISENFEFTSKFKASIIKFLMKNFGEL